MSGKPGMHIHPPRQITTRDPAVIYAEISEARVEMEDITLRIEYLSNELGRALNERRRMRYMSQAALAALAGAGITRDMVCFFETGRRGKRDADYIERLVRLLSERT